MSPSDTTNRQPLSSGNAALLATAQDLIDDGRRRFAEETDAELRRGWAM
jgi:hypothetical protein